MGEILFFGDIHGRFDHILKAVHAFKPDAIVLLGDVQARRPLEVELDSILGKTEIRFIHGNHDTDSNLDYQNLNLSQLGHLNLHGRVDTVAGVRIAGLGGIFRGKVWYPPLPKRVERFADLADELERRVKHEMLAVHNAERERLNHSSTIFPDVYESLAIERADVLVTHEAPSCHPHGFNAIDELARSLGVTKSFHGHHHDNLDYRDQWAALQFEAYGVGFCGITHLDGQIALSGKFDAVRKHRWIPDVPN